MQAVHQEEAPQPANGQKVLTKAESVCSVGSSIWDWGLSTGVVRR